jgi:hypothetical protein
VVKIKERCYERSIPIRNRPLYGCVVAVEGLLMRPIGLD